jgi:hypothetical protein
MNYQRTRFGMQDISWMRRGAEDFTVRCGSSSSCLCSRQPSSVCTSVWNRTSLQSIRHPALVFHPSLPV